MVQDKYLKKLERKINGLRKSTRRFLCQIEEGRGANYNHQLLLGL